jgi:hypothetical protein
MFQLLLNNFRRSEKEKVKDVLFDIELFFNYLERYGQIIDEWYFHNVFSANYWKFLKHYGWLDNSRQEFLHQGVLSMILFQCHQHLEGISMLTNGRIISMKSSMDQFKTTSPTTNKLHVIVQDAITLIKNNNSDEHSLKRSKTEIYSSVLWALKNVILKDTQMNKKE